MRDRVSSTPTVLAGVLAMAIGVFATGCFRQAPIDARLLERSQRGVVAIVTSHGMCSGTLVSPNLILTARHCVSAPVKFQATCDSQGHSLNGAHVAEDVDPEQIAIYAGPRLAAEGRKPNAHAIRSLHPSGESLCDADVAYLVLDRALPDEMVLPLRLDRPVNAGEHVVPIGFGGGVANVLGERRTRGSSLILSVGPIANVRTGAILGAREFEVEVPTCRGDSGGPAIDEQSGEVVGVVSRGKSCLTGGNHVYTRVDAYRHLARAAFTAAARALRDDATHATAK